MGQGVGVEERNNGLLGNVTDRRSRPRRDASRDFTTTGDRRRRREREREIEEKRARDKTGDKKRRRGRDGKRGAKRQRIRIKCRSSDISSDIPRSRVQGWGRCTYHLCSVFPIISSLEIEVSVSANISPLPSLWIQFRANFPTRRNIPP